MSGFYYSEDFSKAMKEITVHPNCSESTAQFVISVTDYAKRKGYVTSKQASAVGGLHKRIVCNGEYRHHNWWTGKF